MLYVVIYETSLKTKNVVKSNGPKYCMRKAQRARMKPNFSNVMPQRVSLIILLPKNYEKRLSC